MGGDCLNYGCVPSKALIAAGKHADALRHGAGFGFADVEPDIDFRKVGEHIRHVIAAIAPNDSAERFTALGVHVIKAEARFKDKRTLIAGDVEIRARRFVIATGSSPVVPADRRPRHGRLSSPTRRSSSRPAGPAIWSSSAAGRSASSWRRPIAGWARRSPSSRPRRRLSSEDPELAAIALERVRADGVTIREAHQGRAGRARAARSASRVQVEGPDGRSASTATHLLDRRRPRRQRRRARPRQGRHRP